RARLLERRAAQPADRRRWDAQRVLTEAQRLFRQNSAETYRQAADQLRAYRQAAQGQLAAGDELDLLYHLINSLIYLREYTEATALAQQGLQLAQQVGDRAHISVMLLKLGDLQQQARK